MALYGSPSNYQCPKWGSRSDMIHGWLREATEEGENYLKNQRSWTDIDRAIDVISGKGMREIPRAQSKVHINMAKRDIRESVATLSNIRPLANFKTDNEYLLQQGQVLNKLFRAWYHNTFADRAIRGALQFAACGTGYLSPVWQKDFWTRGRGDIVLKRYGPRDVLPVQIGSDHDLQQAYAVTLREEVPLNRAWSMFPTQTDLLTPDRGTPTWLAKGVRRVQRFMSPVLNVFGPGQGKEREDSPFPTVDIYKTYILDGSVNPGPTPVEMGDARWKYSVPVYGSDVPTGVNDKNGTPITRKANAEDAAMFPLRRLCIWTSRGVLYDNTSTYWHGKVPVAKFTLDDWPWDFLGYSMTRDANSIQESATRLLRAIDDSANARLDSPLGYDENMLSRGLMERFNPRATGQRIPINLTMGDGVKQLIGADYYNVPEWILGLVEKLYEYMHYVLGTRDIQAIAKARQVPAGDSLEKLMELAGPIITDMSRNMEYSMREVGEQVKSMFFEFYDMPRRVQILGRDGVVEEDFDFKPGDMIPSHTHDEFERIARGEMTKATESRLSLVERARLHQNSFFFHIAPNSMHQITQLTKKMLLLQLWRAGFPIDPWTVAESFDIENYGSPSQLEKIMGSEIPSDVFGRWLAFKEFLNKIGGGQPAPRGRRPSGQQAPQLQSKDGGQRTAVRESAR